MVKFPRLLYSMIAVIGILTLFFSLQQLILAGPYEPMAGDILFHTSESRQSVAIQRATGSRYTHMGIVTLQSGRPFVYEAVGPVKLTPLQEWVDRGKGGHYVAKRLKSHRDGVPAATKAALERAGRRYAGADYDLYFEWSDQRIYCSELIWKIFKEGLGVELAPLRKLESFDLNDPIVRKIARERWGDSPPLNEPVISPVALFRSSHLRTVFAGS
ncbi:MAG: YiiX family permuted papain-like enzyme [Verrucomicrobiota bacterium]